MNAPGSHLTDPLLSGWVYQQPDFELPLSLAVNLLIAVTKGNLQMRVGRPWMWMSASSRRTSWSTRRNWDPIIRTCSANSQQSWMSRWGFPWGSPSGPFIESAHFIPDARRTRKSLFVFLLLKSLCFHEHHVPELFSPPCTTSPVSKERDQVGEKSVGKEDENPVAVYSFQRCLSKRCVLVF